jgi:hypothetical protein
MTDVHVRSTFGLNVFLSDASRYLIALCGYPELVAGSASAATGFDAGWQHYELMMRKAAH